MNDQERISILEARVRELADRLALLLRRWPIPPAGCLCDACSEAVYHHGKKGGWRP